MSVPESIVPLHCKVRSELTVFFCKWTADQAREFVKRTRDALMNGESDVYYEM
jgi:hypothetical protein